MIQIYMVTSPVEHLLHRIERAVLGGVRIVQLRDKKATDDVLHGLGLEIVRLLTHLEKKGHSCSFVVNDRVRVAKELMCGLHLGWEDLLSYADVSEQCLTPSLWRQLEDTLVCIRASLPKESLLGLTIHDRLEIAQILGGELNYVGVGPIFQTNTKKDTKAVLGVEHFRTLVKKSSVPVVGIGGISTLNISELKGAEAKALAMCSVFFTQEDPFSVAQELLKNLLV